MAVKTLTKAEFEEVVLKSDKPVVIDFWATWCGPCRMLSPVVDEISDERNDILFCKVNVDEEKELAEKYEVMSIPLLVYIEKGETVKTSLGYKPKEDVLDFIDNE